MIIKKIVNLTPHIISIGNINISPEEKSLRVNIEYQNIGQLATINVYESVMDKNRKNEEPIREEGTIYIVSNITASTYSDREDFFIPKMSGLICSGLIWNPYFRIHKFRTENEYSEIIKMGADNYKKAKQKIEKGEIVSKKAEPKKGDKSLCLWCGNKFIKKQAKSLFCGSKCGELFRYEIKKNEKIQD